MSGVQTYKVGDWQLESGQSIPDAHIAYKTVGDPKLPAIIYPSWFSGCRLTLLPPRPRLTLRLESHRR
jgi:homoserine acetyltransferase